MEKQVIQVNGCYYNTSNKKWFKILLTINIDSLLWQPQQQTDRLDESGIDFNQISSIHHSFSYFIFPVICVQCNHGRKLWFGSFDNFHQVLNVILHFFEEKIQSTLTDDNDVGHDSRAILSTVQEIRDNMNISAQLLEKQGEQIDQMSVKSDQVHSKITISERILEYFTWLPIRSRQDRIVTEDNTKRLSNCVQIAVLYKSDNNQMYCKGVSSILQDRIIIDLDKTASKTVEILFSQLDNIQRINLWRLIFSLHVSNDELVEAELMSAHMPNIVANIRKKSPSIPIRENLVNSSFLQGIHNQQVLSSSDQRGEARVLGNLLGEIKDIATCLGTESDIQNSKLDRLTTSVENATSRIKRNNKIINHQLE
ncbi:uncharacterized protein TRIADDRAFT_55100 [Trichoplax adhaerens]|uniref:t-SNARE coiled-coil homology domain-containing protein n=1 Tax=Trichoplax adhaerens TaxID=10228 RepID=B3RQS6_TRIAD|nr:hypothetical protein TRIADDRAFT_55100 [Trichoplax adhaerens]EDV27290.1 hypothetical protein TRIADDRAFT_55100 [Trichoplax adhaerens]|eukprot:XP_002111286.1 hypothetical protein TRIADDRAFT_55100 [Trichoplax adhaerens]